MKIDPDECTACGDCSTACPNEAITSKSAYFAVNADRCDECAQQESQQCQDICPSNCITFA